MTDAQVQTRTRAARRAMLGLLAALAVALGCVAAPVTGTAHAGGLAGGVLKGGDLVTRDRGTADGALGSSMDTVEAGAKPDIGSGTN